jgi:hypothetical protein
MTSGSPRTFRVSPAEADKVNADPRVQRQLHRKRSVSRWYDVPYLAGYSKDGRVIYIDRHFPKILAVHGKLIDPTPFILIHEITEKSIIDALGWDYQHSHAVAEQKEDEAWRKVGINPIDAQNALKPFIKTAESERIKAPPPNLDLTPYRDDHDTQTLLHLARAA